MRIDGELDLEQAEIKFSLIARSCAFMGNIRLDDAQLRGLYLTDCFIHRLSAVRARFDGPVHLDGKFKAEGEVKLFGAAINGDLYCSRAQFSNAKGKALDATSAKIGGDVFLRRGFKAEGAVKLLSATIGSDLDCTRSQFSNATGWALDVEASRIAGKAVFREVFQAPGGINLRAATMRLLQIVDMLEAEHTILDLRLTEVGEFWDDEKSWPKLGNLFLDGFRYERLYEESPSQADRRKKWLLRQPQDKFLPQPYEQLAAVLRQMGYERDARLMMIEKNRQRARFTRFPRQAWWWYNFFGRLIGYGYAPWRALAISVLIILFGTFVFYLGFSHDLISPTKENAYVKAASKQLEPGKNGRPKISEDYPVFNAFVYSLESFIPLIKFDQSTNWTPNANRGAISIYHLQVHTGGLLRYYLYFHIAAGWLFTSLWVGAVTGLVKS